MLFGDSPPPPGLVGIARLAAESETLEAKARVSYFEIEARTLMNRTRPGMPFVWTINPYRGCEFGCKYCYARYAHEFMELEPAAFEDRIYAKKNVAAVLKRDLRKAELSEGIAIGTATDPYQPAERRFGRTRAILEVLARERGRRISIITKSDLILRDLDLLTAIREHNRLHVTLTITTLDASLARLLEPRAPRPELRLKAVSGVAETGIYTGVNPNPIMPLITDGEKALDRLAKAARDAGARYFGGGILFLMPSAQKIFFPFLARQFPHLLRKYQERFRGTGRLTGTYPDTIRERIHAIRERYGFDGTYASEGPPPEEDQGNLFDWGSGKIAV